MRPVDHFPKPAGWKSTIREAHDRFCCARCGTNVHPIQASGLGTWTDDERREYWLSGMCKECQDDLFKEE